MENLSQLNDTVEWSTINKMDVIEGSNTIEDELNYLLKTKKATNNLLTNRRDVINKAILRGFKKYFVISLILIKIIPECSISINIYQRKN